MMEKFGKETEQKKADEAKAAADKAAAKPGNAEKKPDSKPAPAASKADSTLNDVVNSLDRLNMMMGQLLSQSEDLGKKQLRASKANSVQP
jgi:membrane protein involved in colicin uptake